MDENIQTPQKGGFKDFIPEGQDTGGQGDGFKDWVPSSPEDTARIEALESKKTETIVESSKKPSEKTKEKTKKVK